LRLVFKVQAGNDMIGLARLHCYRQGVFKLVDVPVSEAQQRQRELALDDWVVAYTQVV